MSYHIIIMNGLLLLNIIIVATSYIHTTGIFRIPFNKVYELYKNLQLPDAIDKNKRKIFEYPKLDEKEDWESGEIPWDLDKNITKSRKNTGQDYEKTDAYRLCMLMM